MVQASKEILDELRTDVQNESPEYIASKWIIEKTPFIFNGDISHFLKVKNVLAEKLGVDSCSIIFVGSSGTGFSLNPNKSFKIFDNESDIDIAIISHYYFEVAWRKIVELDTMRQTPEAAYSIKDHRNRLIFYGTIATDKILGLLPFAKKWLSAMNYLEKDKIFENREIHFRLYRDHESLRKYHVNNIKTSISTMLCDEVSPLIKNL